MNRDNNNYKFHSIHIYWIILIALAKFFQKKIIFWGASLFLEAFLKKYNIKSPEILGIIDKDITKQNSTLYGYKIFSPDELENLKPNYIIYAIKNNNKKIYQEIKSYLKLNYPKIKLLPNFFQKNEKKQPKLNKKTVKAIDNIISEIAPKKAVYIFQPSFYDKTGGSFFSGGAERYLIDLADLITQLGYKPILIQEGNENLKSPWVNNKQNLTIIGINSSDCNYFDIINRLKEPVLAIYSGIINWDLNIKYKNKLLISHGITWDIPTKNADIKFLKNILKAFKHIISVDTNTISWFRSTFSYYMNQENINAKYLPNYVDLKKYFPKENKRNKIKITFPRRCSKERGFSIFAEIIPLILEKYKDILIEFVGFIQSNAIGNDIERLLKKYPQNVSHTVCEQDKMENIYQNTDISVIPTLYAEGTSLSCLEAMACKNAVIATNIGGLPNLIINDFNGKLINPDSASLYNAIVELLNDEQKRNYLAKNALLVSQAFNKENWKKEWLNILRQYLI